MKELSKVFLWACRNGHIDLVRQLVKCGVDVNSVTVECGETGLMLASLEGNLDMVRNLVELGADVNIQCHQDYTALIYASGEGHLKVVKYLVDFCPVKLYYENEHGNTALEQAIKRDRMEVLKYLVDKITTDDRYKVKDNKHFDELLERAFEVCEIHGSKVMMDYLKSLKREQVRKPK